MATQTWLHTNLLWPTLQSVAGAGILAIGLAGTAQFTRVVGGCPIDVAATIAKGERALIDGNTARALAFAGDGLVSAPHSPCSNAFAAASELQAMREQLAKHDRERSELYRARCFQHANRASPLFGSSPRVDAILEACRAS